MNKRLFGYFLLGFALVCLDQILKIWALTACVNNSLLLMPFVRCELTFNRGIAFGTFHSASTLLFWVLTIGILLIVCLMAWLARQRAHAHAPVLGHVLIIVGALGNTIDRFLHGAVIDFILIFYKDWYFPIFNGADIYIVCGVALLFWYEIHSDA